MESPPATSRVHRRSIRLQKRTKLHLRQPCYVLVARCDSLSVARRGSFESSTEPPGTTAGRYVYRSVPSSITPPCRSVRGGRPCRFDLSLSYEPGAGSDLKHYRGVRKLIQTYHRAIHSGEWKLIQAYRRLRSLRGETYFVSNVSGCLRHARQLVY